MMFAIFFFSHKFIFSHSKHIYCSYHISYFLQKKDICQDSIDYVLGTNKHLKAQYHNIVININEKFTLHWYRVDVCSTLGPLYLWHMTSTCLCASPIGHEAWLVVFSAPAQTSHILPPITFYWAEYYIIWLTQDLWKVYFHVYSTRRNKKQIF